MNAISDPDSFEQPWPAFLELLDNAPRKAAEKFYRKAHAVLSVAPPRVMQTIRPENRPDAIQDICFHFIDKDFRVLKQYRNQGGNFAAWFVWVSRMKIIEIIRKPNVIVPLSNQPELKLNYEPDSDRWKSALRIVVTRLEKLDEKCRLLLFACMDESKPGEIAAFMGLPSLEGKKISGRIIDCRNKLKELVLEAGLELKTLF